MPTTAPTDRFRAEIDRLITETPSASARLGVAVSGGPDSLALLLLAAQAFPDAIAAATVDHGLRPEAADEARYVAALCEQRDIPHTILTPAEPITGNIQSAARNARYALLDDWCHEENLAWVATGHHADDQFETLLMRLMRGSGVDGLSAIRPVNAHIVRPLLRFRKAELERYVAGQSIDAIADPSNRDDAYDRVRLRKALTAFPDFEPERIARSVDAAREASEALQWMALREAETHVEHRGETVILTSTAYPDELLRRLVILCLDRIDESHAVRGPALDRVIQALQDQKTGTIGKILYFSKNPGIWCFSKAPPRKTG